MHANSREDIKEANVGDIVALAGLKTQLQDIHFQTKIILLLEPMEFPDPVIEIAVEPKLKLTKKKWEKH